MSDIRDDYKRVQAAIAALASGGEAIYDRTEWFYPAPWYDDAATSKNEWLDAIMRALVEWLDKHCPDGEP